MNIYYLLLSLIIAPFSYAYYGPPTSDIDMEMGSYSTSFKIGRDVYTYGTFYSNISKFGIDENKNYYSQVLFVDDLTFACGFCFSFVMSDDSVLTSTGYDTSDDPGGDTSNKMGFFYLNPIAKTITKPSGYKTLPGTPNQRVYHQVVMPSDKKSVYIFGGLDVEQANISSTSIIQFDIASSTFTTHGNFTFVGGAATMLPSGIVVLAFGSSTVDQPDGNILYDTSSVFLYDTNSNELYKQNISGTPPKSRASTTGVLGPDNECIYYYGGSNFDIYFSADYMTSVTEEGRVRPLSDLVVLNTSSWTWYSPNVPGPPPGGRFDHMSILYEDNTLIIGGGQTEVTADRFDICVLRNLPDGDKETTLDNLQWFANSELDTLYNGGDTDKLSDGAIAGIAIGVGIPMIILFYFLRSDFGGFRRIIWRKRLGEPAWTEILRNIIRIILLGVLIAYIVYTIVRAVDSPNLNELKTIEIKKMPMPDVRICSDVETFPYLEFDIKCGLRDGEDCSQHVYRISNSTLLPIVDLRMLGPCQVFVPPLDMYFETIDYRFFNQKIGEVTLELFKKDINKNVTSYYVTYYTSQFSPYRTLLGLAGDNSKMSLYDAYVWLQKEQNAPTMANTFSINDHSYVTTEYSLTETLSLTNSSWNYFGFASDYDTSLDVTQSVGTIGLLPGSISSYHSSLMVNVKPSEYLIHRVTEQRVSTILSGLASAGGVFSIIIAIQTLLFGFRPNSPWGIVHRWSFGRQRRSLRDQLRDGFNTDNAPVPMATRVRGDYHLLPIASGPMAQLDENRDDQDYRLELKKVQERIQLMEDLLKTYYIDDEIFQKLNEAREHKARNSDEKTTKVKDEVGFSALYQEDEETPFYKRD